MVFYLLTFAGFFFFNTAWLRNPFYVSLPISLYVLWVPLTREVIQKNKLLFVCFALFMCFTVISCFWSGQTGSCFEKSKIIVFLPVGIIGLLPLLIKYPRYKEIVAQFFVGSAVLTGILLIVFRGPAFVFHGVRLNGYGHADNSVACGLLYGCALLILCYNPAFRRFPAAARWSAGPVLAAVIFMAQSRGPFVALGVSFFILSVLRGDWRRVVAFMVAAFGVVGAYVLSPAVRDLSLFVRADSARFGIWKEAWSLIEKRLWFGYGIASKFDFPSYNAYYGSVFNARQTHNLYVGTILHTGFVGLSLFLALAGIVFWQGWWTARRTSNYQPLALVLMGLCLGLFDFGEYYINLDNEWIVFWFPMIFIAAEAFVGQRLASSNDVANNDGTFRNYA